MEKLRLQCKTCAVANMYEKPQLLLWRKRVSISSSCLQFHCSSERSWSPFFLSPSLSFKLGLKHNVSQTKAITGMLLLTLGNTRFPLATGGCQLVTVMSVGLCDTGLIHFMLQWWSHIQNSGKANATWLKDTGLQKVSMPIDCIAWHTLHAIVNLNSAEETCLISSPFLIMLANTQSTNQHFFTGYTEMSVFQNVPKPLKCPFLAVSSLLRLSFI